jgi:hypothetical protein
MRAILLLLLIAASCLPAFDVGGLASPPNTVTDAGSVTDTAVTSTDTSTGADAATADAVTTDAGWCRPPRMGPADCGSS